MRIRKNSEWGVKILEQPGSPLLTKFVKKFPVDQGCPRSGECTLCDDDGIKCAPKSVIYKGVCKQCKNNKSLTVPVYVGETSRPWRERIREHVENTKKLKPDSVIVQHWAEQHGTHTVSPEFEFSIIGQYKDPLRRQICEAIQIIDQGTLNRKSEFNVNELCRLETNRNWKEVQSNVIKEAESRTLFNNKLRNFVDVMKKVSCNVDTESEILNTCRLKRPNCWPEIGQLRQEKKLRMMNCSTPTTYRTKLEIPEDHSPIGPQQVSDESQNESEDQVVCKLNRSPTNVSTDLGSSVFNG